MPVVSTVADAPGWQSSMSFSFGAGTQDRDDDAADGGGKRKAPAFSFGGASTPAGAGAAGGFKFGGAAAGGDAPAASPKGAAPAFAFGGGGGDAAAASTGGGFSFGGAKPAAAAGGGFAFGATAAAPAGGGGFAFQVGGSSAAAASPKEDEEEEAPDLDQKPEVAKGDENENEETVDWGGKDAKSKLFTLTDTQEELESQLEAVKKGGDNGKGGTMTVAEAEGLVAKGKAANFKQWKAKGVNTVGLVKDKASGNTMVRMRSENGQQLLLNDWAHTIKPTKVQTKQMTLITASGNHMLKFGQEETRDELFDLITGKSGGSSAAPAAAKPAAAAVAKKASPVKASPEASTKRKAEDDAAPPSKSFNLGAKKSAEKPAAASGGFGFGAKKAASPPAAATKSFGGFGAGGSSSSAASSSAASSYGGGAEPDVQLHALNKAFLSHISAAVSKDSTCDLTPCLQDYLKHAKKIGS